MIMSRQPETVKLAARKRKLGSVVVVAVVVVVGGVGVFGV